MDDSVIRAMARWPDVPAVYGWLSLDRRGRWCLQGRPVLHRGAVEFMNRNYDCTADGRWYFQNGPQRAYVDLDYTPFVFSLDGAGALVDHTGGRLDVPRDAWLDESGNLLLRGGRGVGLVSDRDLEPVSGALRRGDGGVCEEEDLALAMSGAGAEPLYLRWNRTSVPVGVLASGDVPGRFGFDPRPRDESPGTPPA